MDIHPINYGSPNLLLFDQHKEQNPPTCEPLPYMKITFLPNMQLKIKFWKKNVYRNSKIWFEFQPSSNQLGLASY